MQVVKQPEHGGASTTKEKKFLISEELWLIANNSKKFSQKKIVEFHHLAEKGHVYIL